MNTFYIILSLTLYYAIVSSIQYSLEEDKIYILIGEETFLINLIKNSITKELISLMPIKTKLVEKNDSEINLPLSVEIETDSIHHNNDIIKANIGDLFLVKGQKKLVLFNEYKTFINNNDEFFKIGNSEHTNKIVNFIAKNRSKSCTLLNTLNYADVKGKIKPYTYNTLMNYFTWKIFTFFCFLFL